MNEIISNFGLKLILITNTKYLIIEYYNLKDRKI